MVLDNEQSRLVQDLIEEVKMLINPSRLSMMVAIVRTDVHGVSAWSFEQHGVKAGDTVILPDGVTTAFVHYVHDP